METTLPDVTGTVDELVEDAVRLARRWHAATGSGTSRTERRATARLAALVSDPAGLELAVRFVDRVARPEDRQVAARELAGLLPAAHAARSFLGPADLALLRLGARVAPLVPAVAVPLARRRLRQLVGHLVGDADGRGLTRQLASTRAQGFGVNVNLLGEAVLGEDEARRRLARTRELVARPDVDHLSVKASAVASQLSTWDTAGSRDRLVERLLPLLRLAHEHGVFVNLDMEEYRDLELTQEVFTALLTELPDVHAGIVLQAYLPDSGPALDALTDFSRRRGGPGIAVRLVKGANLAMERVEAELHGWTQAPYASKAEVDANYVRLLDRGLQPERARHVRIGVASHNLFHVALAWLIASSRGTTAALDVEMLQGMGPAQARAVQADVDRVVLYTPVVGRDDFEVAVSYLVRRLEEGAAPQNFLHEAFAGDLGSPEQAFRDSVRDRERPGTDSRRSVLPAPTAGFGNAPDSDPTLAATRAWARTALAGAPAPLATPLLTSTAAVDAVVERALAAGRTALPPAARAALLRDVAVRLADRRGELVAVMAHEAGKTVAESDPEISEAIDFARYYAERALDEVPGARCTPARLVVVTPPWNFPVAIPLGSALAALAAGSPVLLKPAPQTPRCVEVAAAAVTEALLAAELSGDWLQVVRVPDDDAGRRLVTHPAVDRVVLTGSLETARLFAGWRPETVLIGETSGKNAIVVTPAADLDLAVVDVVRSAFGHAGQKCSAASLVIQVGSVARSGRFRRQLVDAVRSLQVGPATELGTTVGPLTEPATGPLLRALTTLAPGESWLVEPRQLGPALWSPGVRDGVSAGSWFHLTECFGPVLGLMTAPDLDAALALQDAVAHGLTGGLQSLDEAEIDHWLDRVQVGCAYVNRGITGAIVRRQPFGGWKASAVGPGAKAGGPHYVAQLADWADAPDLPTDDAGWLAWAEADDARAWADRFGVEHDPSALAAESDVLRYRPVPHLTVRVGVRGREREVTRVLSAARTAGVPVTLSRADEVPDQAFAAAVARGEVLGRVRVVGAAPGLRAAAATALGTVTVLDAPVVASAERELLTVLREQTVSRTLHRFGHLPARGL